MATMNLRELAQQIISAGGDAAKIEGLLKGGVGAGRNMTPEDRISWIKGLESIGEVRKALKVAAAKKSKSQGAERYIREIEAGNARLNDLLAQAEADEGGSLIGLISLGEEEGRLLQAYIESREALIAEALRPAEAKIGKAKVKGFSSGLPFETPGEIANDISELLGQSALERYNKRAKDGDLRVRSLNQKTQFLKAFANAEMVEAKATEMETEMETTMKTTEAEMEKEPGVEMVVEERDEALEEVNI